MAEFVDKDGTVYHKGKEQPKLKGTLPPTEVKPRKKPTKKRRTKEQILLDRHEEKKSSTKESSTETKKFFESQHRKIINGNRLPCINMQLSYPQKWGGKERGVEPITTNRSMIRRTFDSKGIDYASEITLKNVET